MITLRNVAKHYGTRCVLEIDHLHVAAGKAYAVIGHNGAGKTTLLRLLGGVEPPTMGSILRECPASEVVLCFQRPYLFHGTVERNLTYGPSARGWKTGLQETVREVAECLRLGDLLPRDARRLSAGEAQRVALGRSLACRPKVLLLDEPTANVDAESTGLMQEAIQRWHRNGVAVVLATHVPEHASRLGAEVHRLVNGRLARPE
jgi:tungstate transport system ATP-binding protein